MSARWDQIIEKTWYPYLPHEKIYWFECRQQISEEQAILIEKIKSLNSYSTLSSEYWFPSKFSRSKLHITTVDTIWRYCLHDLGLPYTSLIDFSLRWRHANNTSYSYHILTQYILPARKVLKADEIASILIDKTNKRK